MRPPQHALTDPCRYAQGWRGTVLDGRRRRAGPTLGVPRVVGEARSHLDLLAHGGGVQDVGGASRAGDVLLVRAVHQNPLVAVAGIGQAVVVGDGARRGGLRSPHMQPCPLMVGAPVAGVLGVCALACSGAPIASTARPASTDPSAWRPRDRSCPRREGTARWERSAPPLPRPAKDAAGSLAAMTPGPEEHSISVFPLPDVPACAGTGPHDSGRRGRRNPPRDRPGFSGGPYKISHCNYG